MDDNELRKLAQRVQRSDHMAFQLLFHHLWKDMEILSYSIVHNKEAAEDILQELWLDYWRNREKWIVDHIRSYLLVAVRNRCYKYLRDGQMSQQQLDVIEEFPDEEMASTEGGHNDALLQRLQQAISELPERCREIFILSRIEGHTNSDISERLGITRKTVENHISTALKKLRTEARNLHLLVLSLF